MKRITFGLFAMIISLLLPQHIVASTETYDFKTQSLAGCSLVMKSSSADFIGADGTQTLDYADCVNNSDGTLNQSLNNRFALKKSSNYWDFRNHTTHNGLYHYKANATHYVAICNLLEGDKITIECNGDLYFETSNAKDANENAIVGGTTKVDKGTEYTMTEAGYLLVAAKTNYISIHKVTIETSAQEQIGKPEILVTSVNNGQRTISINPGVGSVGSEATATYYTIDGSDPSSSDTRVAYENPFIISTTTTVKAVSYLNNVVSEVAELEVEAGTSVKLVTPVITMTGMAENNGIYYPVVTISSDNSSVLGKPSTVSYKAQLDGKDVVLDNTSYTFTSVGTLTVTSSAEGYADSEPVQYTASSYAFSTLYDFSNPEFTSVYTEGVEEGFEAGNQYSSAKAFKSDFEGKTYVVNATDGIFDFMELQTNHNLLEGVGILNVGTGNRWVKLTNLTNKVIAKFEFVTSKSGSETVVEMDGNSQAIIPRYNALKAITIYSPVQTVTVNEYSTFSSTTDVDFSAAEGLTVYTAKLNDAKDMVTLAEVESKKVPAGAGVLLKGTGKFTGVATTGVAKFENNDLIANTEAKTVTREDNIYVLNNVDGIGFYPFKGTLTVGKAHLVIEGGNARTIKIAFGGDTTGISNVESKASGEADVWHTLSGVRVQNPTKGLYIVNGKKVVVK